MNADYKDKSIESKQVNINPDQIRTGQTETPKKNWLGRAIGSVAKLGSNLANKVENVASPTTEKTPEGHSETKIPEKHTFLKDSETKNLTSLQKKAFENMQTVQSGEHDTEAKKANFREASPVVSITDPVTDDNIKEHIKQGHGNQVAAYVKQRSIFGTKGRDVDIGPQNQTPETKQMENILNGLLENFEGYDFSLDTDGTTLVTHPNGDTENFTEIAANTNFSQLSLSPEKLEIFMKLIESSDLSDRIQGLAKDVVVPIDPKLSSQGELTKVEKFAIGYYTSNEYKELQNAFKGDLLAATAKYSDKNSAFKLRLLLAIVAAATLEKLPNYEPKNANNRFLYRYDQISQDELNKRIEAVGGGGNVTNEQGMISTSHTTPAESFEQRNVIVLYENCKGKSIESMAAMDEREIVLPPTQVQWTHYYTYFDENGAQQHVFVAKAVSSPT